MAAGGGGALQLELEPDAHAMAMTDQELEDFLNFMEHPPGGVLSGPLASYAAAPEPPRPAAAPAASSDAAGSSGGVPPAGAAGNGGGSAAASAATAALARAGSGGCASPAPRSPGSSEDCTAPACEPCPFFGGLPGLPALGCLPEGEAYPCPAAPAPAAPMPVPPRGGPRPLPLALRGGGAGSAPPAAGGFGHHPDAPAARGCYLTASQSAASLGSLSTPLEGLALASPGGSGPLPQLGGSLPAPVLLYGGTPCRLPAFDARADASPFGPVGGGFVPTPHAGGCGAPPLAASYDDLPAAAASAGLRHAASWPAGAASSPAPPPARPPSSARRSGRGGGTGAGSPAGAAAAAAGGGGDATYHRSSGGNATLSHSTIEKQRRDRLNGLLDDLGTLVPPADGRPEASRRPKHVILSDAIALLTALREQLRLSRGEAAALRARVAAAEARAAAAAGAAGAGAGAAAINIGAGRGAGAGGRAGHHSGSRYAPGLVGLLGAEAGSNESTLLTLPPTPGGTPPFGHPASGASHSGGALAGACGGADGADGCPPLLLYPRRGRGSGGCSGAGSPASPGCGSPAPGRAPAVFVEQEGCRVHVVAACEDRDGLLSELVAALKAFGAITKARPGERKKGRGRGRRPNRGTARRAARPPPRPAARRPQLPCIPRLTPVRPHPAADPGPARRPPSRRRQTAPPATSSRWPCRRAARPPPPAWPRPATLCWRCSTAPPAAPRRRTPRGAASARASERARGRAPAGRLLDPPRGGAAGSRILSISAMRLVGGPVGPAGLPPDGWAARVLGRPRTGAAPGLKRYQSNLLCKALARAPRKKKTATPARPHQPTCRTYKAPQRCGTVPPPHLARGRAPLRSRRRARAPRATPQTPAPVLLCTCTYPLPKPMETIPILTRRAVRPPRAPGRAPACAPPSSPKPPAGRPPAPRPTPAVPPKPAV
jgi:hypothetical protein